MSEATHTAPVLHLKGLNGLRAIAAIAVVLAHLRILLPEFPSISQRHFDLANYAVTIFFTLSGFLITYLLVQEKKKAPISIKYFYIRRILRIWPLYFFYLALAIITIAVYEPVKLPGALPYYLFFAANIPSLFNNHLPFLAQYWSLGVEEQFYIFWPWLIKGSKNVFKAIIIFTACFMLLKIIAKLILHQTGDISFMHALEVNRFECMSLGGVAALLCDQRQPLFMKLVTHPITQLLCWLSLPLMALNYFHLMYFSDNDMVALVTACLIVNLAFNPKNIINLENRFFDFIGKISYGIYIIHPLVIFFYGKLLAALSLTGAVKLIGVYTGVLGITILLAWLSYELLEKRFLQMKGRFSTIKTFDSKYARPRL